MDQLKATFDKIMQELVKLVDDIINKYLRDIKIDLFN